MAGTTDYERMRAAVEGHRLPLAYVDLDAFDANAEALAGRAAGMPIRVASKSVRCRAMLQRVLAHPGFQGLMCFTAGEAAFLAARGFDDLLVAYPTVEPTEVEAVCRAVAEGRRIVLMIDAVEQLDPLEAIAARVGVTLPICLDVDMSMSLPGLWFGVRRSPIRDAAAALRVGRALERRHHLCLEGVMGYEAQIAGLADDVPGKGALNLVIRRLKRRSIPELTERRVEVVEALRNAGFPIRLVNGGGTGSLESTRRDPSVTELTAGSGLYAPGLFDDYESFTPAPAAGFAIPVVRRPGAGLITCHGGGYVASGAAGNDKLPRPFLPRGASLLPNEGAGEVMTPLAYDGEPRLELGDPVFMRHAKAGELCERFNTLLLIEDGRVVDEVPTYRGDGQAFL